MSYKPYILLVLLVGCAGPAMPQFDTDTDAEAATVDGGADDTGDTGDTHAHAGGGYGDRPHGDQDAGTDAAADLDTDASDQDATDSQDTDAASADQDAALPPEPGTQCEPCASDDDCSEGYLCHWHVASNAKICAWLATNTTDPKPPATQAYSVDTMFNQGPFYYMPYNRACSDWLAQYGE